MTLGQPPIFGRRHVLWTSRVKGSAIYSHLLTKIRMMIEQFKYLPWLNLQSLTEKNMAGLGRTPNLPPQAMLNKHQLYELVPLINAHLEGSCSLMVLLRCLFAWGCFAVFSCSGPWFSTSSVDLWIIVTICLLKMAIVRWFAGSLVFFLAFWAVRCYFRLCRSIGKTLEPTARVH